MAEKSLKRIRVKGLRVAPMQTCVAVPITDPAEIAELEARIKRYEDGERSARIRSSAWASKKITVAELLELASQLSARSRVQLVTGLSAQMSAKEQAALIKQLMGKHAADGHHRLR
jgi:hypothetical protein